MTDKLLEFALMSNPSLMEEYEIYCTKPEDLVGRIVYANAGGFSCGSGGGTEMKVRSFDSKKGYMSFDPTENSKHLTHSGWSCRIDQLWFKIRLTKERNNIREK